MGSEAHALYARVGTCEDSGHGGRYMSLAVRDAVGFDADGHWPIDACAAGWSVEPGLCDRLEPGTEHVLLCATSGLCIDTL